MGKRGRTVMLAFVLVTGTTKGIPFQVSDELEEIGFTGQYVNYTTADTWYPTWADDGNLYSPYTDGAVDGILSISDADWNNQGNREYHHRSCRDHRKRSHEAGGEESRGGESQYGPVQGKIPLRKPCA